MNVCIRITFFAVLLLAACTPKQVEREVFQPVSLEGKTQEPAKCEALWQALHKLDQPTIQTHLEDQVHPHCMNAKGEWPLFFVVNMWQPLQVEKPDQKAAIRAQLIEISKLLTAHGADVNFDDGEKSSALYMAAFFDIPELIALFLERGGDPLQESPTGLSPLDVSRMMGHQKAAELLLAEVE